MNAESGLSYYSKLIKYRIRYRLYVLMRWSLLPDALRPFKIYCASPSITSQLVLFLWQTVEIGPLGHVRVEALRNFVQKCDPVTLSGIHIHIAGVQHFIAVETPSA